MYLFQEDTKEHMQSEGYTIYKQGKQSKRREPPPPFKQRIVLLVVKVLVYCVFLRVALVKLYFSGSSRNHYRI
jgi:hypothetical protein